MRWISLTLFTFAFAAAHAMSSPPPCEQVRGAFDIGSGSTKAYVAVADICKKKIVKVLLDEQTPIAFKDSLEKSSDQTIDTEVLEEGRVKFQTLVEAMKRLKTRTISAVATAAFRSAQNGPAAARAIAGSSGVEIRIITQKEEAELGVKSALTMAKDLGAGVPAVWDIGGGSMQISYMDEDQQLKTFAGDVASVSFKNRVITDLQKKDATKVNSPNPLNSNCKKAAQLAQTIAEKTLPETLKGAAAQKRWVGVGGVWGHSVRKQVRPDSVASQPLTFSQIEKTLYRRCKLKDSEIGGAYAVTEVTNLALVVGFMKALHIESVQPLEASLVQALIWP